MTVSRRAILAAGVAALGGIAAGCARAVRSPAPSVSLTSLVGSPGVHFRQSQNQHSTPLVRQLAGAAGYRSVLSYDVDSLDYTDLGPDAIRRAVASAQPGSIVSMHFGHPGTVTAMPSILADLTSRGLAAVTATQLLRA